MAVRHRDLGELEYAIDNRTGNRTERMDIRDAGADDHEADTLEMGAGGICNDYHNECDSAWDGVEDTRMVLWAGAGDLVGRGTYIPGKAEKNPIKAFFFDEIEKIALEDFNRHKKNFERFLLGLPLI